MGPIEVTKDGERRRLVTLNVNGVWRPTSVETGKTCEFWAFPSSWVVDSFYALDEGLSVITHTGEWTEDKARRFAWSMAPIGRRDGGWHWTEVREVPEYWYVHGYGEVSPVADRKA